LHCYPAEKVKTLYVKTAKQRRSNI